VESAVASVPPVPAAPNPPVESINSAPQVASNAPVESLRDRLAARRAERADDVAAPAAHTGPTRIAVEVSGDPALTLPAQQLLEDKFSGAGMNVVENSSKADVVVRVRAEVIGSQDIQFYGQNAVLTSAYLGVRPYGRNGRPLGTGFRQRIDYTPLSAEAKVQQMLESNVQRLLNNVGDKQ
jgi:serine/threonine-protein kinase